MIFLTHHRLKNYNTWQVGGEADYFCEPINISEVQEALAWALDKKIPYCILSGGSNVLFHDDGFRGLVIGLRKLTGLEIENSQSSETYRVIASAGTSKAEILKYCLRNKLEAALMFAGLPGDVGGGVVMNAGVSENFKIREFCQIVEWIEVVREDGSVQRIRSEDLSWDYRHCDGWGRGVIVRVGLKFAGPRVEDIGRQVREVNLNRLSKQPLDKPSCGSVFRNPVSGLKAAQLIDSCGLKGYTVGGAQVSLKHANFIINLGEATAKDIAMVIQHVKDSVYAKFQVRLQSEVVWLGPWEQGS